MSELVNYLNSSFLIGLALMHAVVWVPFDVELLRKRYGMSSAVW